MSFSIRKWLVSIISIAQWVHAVPPTAGHLGVVWICPMGEEGMLTVLKTTTFMSEWKKIKVYISKLRFKQMPHSYLCASRQNYKIHSTVSLDSTDLDNTLVFTFGPTLQFEWVTMKQGCFSTAGTLTGSGTFIVVREWCHAGEPKRSWCGAEYSSLCPSSSGNAPNSLSTSLTLSGTRIDGTVRHFGLKFPPNSKYYVC